MAATFQTDAFQNDAFEVDAGGGEINGSGAATLPAIAAVGAGDVIVEGTGAADLGPIAASGSGDVDVGGIGAADLMPISSSGTGSVVSGISGAGAATLPPIAASGDATVTVSGDGAATLPPVSTSGDGAVTILAVGILVLPPIGASGSGGTPIEGGLAPFAIIGETTRPEPWVELERPGFWDGTERPSWWAEIERPVRWDATERPEPWVLSIRPSPFGESARPSFWAETVFVREDRAVALTMVAYGPFTENEIPEALLIRVMKPLKAGGTAPMVIFNQTPAYVASVSIEDPAAAVVTRVAEVMDPADLPIDYPDDFAAAEEGWVRVAWAALDFDVEGTYQVQVTLDNGVIVLKSTDVWQPEVNVGPASAVT